MASWEYRIDTTDDHGSSDVPPIPAALVPRPSNRESERGSTGANEVSAKIDLPLVFANEWCAKYTRASKKSGLAGI